MIRRKLVLVSFILSITLGLAYLLPQVHQFSHSLLGDYHSHGLPRAFAATSISSVKSGNWSDPKVWASGAVPQAGDRVSIGSGHAVIYDVFSNAVLGQVDISGTLYFSREKDTRLKTNDNIMVMNGGFLDLGTSQDFIPQGTTTEIIWAFSEGVASSFSGGDTFKSTDKGLWAMSGSRWEVHGAPLSRSWSRLIQDADAGAHTLIVEDNVADWYLNGYVIITPTNVARNYSIRSSDGREFGRSSWQGEVRRVVGLEPLTGGRTRIVLDQPLKYDHSGTDPVRAAVGHLTRNILLTTETPGDSPTDLNPDRDARRYAHTMFMHGASGSIKYAEFRRMGHQKASGRYPVHLHMLGHDFKNKQDPGSGMLIRGNSVWISGNRLYVVHDTNGALIEDNVGFNGFDHGFYLEKSGSTLSDPEGGLFCRDCPEGPHSNVFTHNLGVYARSDDGNTAAVANFWLEHLDQILLGNYASGGGVTNTTGANDSLKGGGFSTAESANGSGRIQIPLFIKNEAVSNFTNGLWAWNNNIPSNMAIIEFSAIRNGTSGMRWGAYSADYRFYQSQFIENGRFGFDITSVRSHLQDSLVQGGSSSGSSTDIGFFIGNYVAALSPNGPIRLTRTTFQDHRTVDLRQISAACSDTAKEKAVMVTGLINNSCGPVYLEALGTQFLSPKALDFGSPANANNFWRVFDRTGFPNTLYLRSDQLNPAKHGDLTSGLVPPVSSKILSDSSSKALAVPLIAYTGPIQFPNLRDHRGQPFSYTFNPTPDYPPEVDVRVSLQGSLAKLTVTATDDNAVALIEIFLDEKKVGEGTSATIDLSRHGRKFAYLYARAFDNKGQVSYSIVTEVGAPSSYDSIVSASNQPPVVNAGPDLEVTLASPATASLKAMVSDDGLPKPPGKLTLEWSKVSGPGSVTFAHPAAALTTATFTEAGDYVLRLTAHDGELSASDSLTVTVGEQQKPPAEPSGGLTGHWTFDEGSGDTASDTSGNANHGALVNNPQWVNGVVDTALKFNGTNDHVSIPHGPELQLSSQITIAAWINPASDSGVDKRIVNKRRSSTRTTYSLQYNPGSGVHFNFNNCQGDSIDSLNFGDLPTGLWSHVAATFQQSANTVVIYVDGVEAGRNTVSGAPCDKDTGDLYIGGHPGHNQDRWFKGVIDDIRIYNRALAPEEVAALAGPASAYQPINQPPVVSAGPGLEVTLASPATASLNALVADDGLPNPPGEVGVEWSLVSGPSTVSFADPTQADTTATFTEAGDYVLRLTAHDGELTTSAQVTVTVNPNPADNVVSSDPLAISDLTVASGKDYHVVYDGLESGAPVYIDRSFTFSSPPDAVAGATYIITANDDKTASQEDFLSFQVNQPVTVYVAYDARFSAPDWLSGWTPTGKTLDTTDTPRNLFAKDFAKGSVTLGGNNTSSAGSTYSVIVVATSEAVKESVEVVFGDANLDGQLTSDDVYLVLDWLIGEVSMPEPGTPAFVAADVNGDGQITMDDVDLMIQKLNIEFSKLSVEP